MLHHSCAPEVLAAFAARTTLQMSMVLEDFVLSIFKRRDARVFETAGSLS